MLFHKRRRELGEYSADGGDQAGFGVVGDLVGDVLDVWPNEVVQRVQVGGELPSSIINEFFKVQIKSANNRITFNDDLFIFFGGGVTALGEPPIHLGLVDQRILY